MEDDREQRVTEDDLKRIIQRAAEIDARMGDTFPLKRLYSIADELGISREAVSEALEERGPEKPGLVRFEAGGVLKSAVMAGAVGVLAGLLRPLALYETVHAEALVSVTVIATVMLVEALRPRTDRPQLSFQLTSLLGWAAFFSAFALMAPAIGDDAVGMFAVFAAASAAIGGLITQIRSSRTSSTSPPSGPSLPAADQPETRGRWAWLKDGWEGLWRRVRPARAI